MSTSVEVRCIVCQLVFCCANCRLRHERTNHNLTYDCPICRGKRFLCRPEELNDDFIKHLSDEHVPLQCRKCNKVFDKMEDLFDIDKCVTLSELVDAKYSVGKDGDNAIEDKFDSLYNNVASNNGGEDFEAIVSINKSNRTAVITPLVRKRGLVDYELSETETELSQMEDTQTPHPKVALKTPRFKKQRAATPHAKKFITLIRQKAVDDYEDVTEDNNTNGSPINGTPSGFERLEVSDSHKEVTTPTSQLPHVLKLAQAVTTSTPTHAASGGWTLFDAQGADSPLSEIDTAESPAQSIDNDTKPDSDNVLPKLKSIIVAESRLRVGSQDSCEKPGTSLETDNSTETSMKVKKVKFAQDTVFDTEPKHKRVYRKPKRMLTPGPQRPQLCYNPRFQALINRFESQARTPVHNKRGKDTESTPPVGEHSVQARAIDFKEESLAAEAETHCEESNELFKTCIGSPSDPAASALKTLTTNIADTLEACLKSVLHTTEEQTEIQFQFVIAKRKIGIERYAGNLEAADGRSNKTEKESEQNKENLWKCVARAVKNVLWGNRAPETPYIPLSSNDTTASSASKRKFEEMSDSELSPLNHKRHKYGGRIPGRPPLRRSKSWGLNDLFSQKNENSQMNNAKLTSEEVANQSF